jgi:CBS domain-containing protein
VIASQKPLFALTAADLMTQSVVMVPEHMSLPCAARLLSRSHVTGAPVVDETGRCIGVLSATDFLRWVESGKATAGHAAHATFTQAWQIVDPEELPGGEVRAHMTPDPVFVAPTAPLGELARKMLDAHIHRVIVAGPDGHPVGIVSSTDLLAALARADEARRLQEQAPAEHAAAELCAC